ncbi:MAG TPA: ABC transporter substrate-binding protein [Candidatus Binatia bacterium]|nr:ABC transporter substrate-binding protein [Candidatus Binatia bacterium]
MSKFRLMAPFMVLMLVLAACGNGDDPGNGGDGDGDLTGETVSVVVVWGGAELESFQAMVAPWEEETGATVEIESTRDIDAVLQTRVEGGTPPDIAGLPGPGVMAQFARDGALQELPQSVKDVLAEQYDAGWEVAGTVDDQLVGVFIKTALKGLIWYNPAQFEAAGYSVPEDWDGMTALVDQMAADGTTPWGIGLESGAATGWPGTDWVEDFVLRQSGPDVYDAWVAGEQAWSSPEIRAAFEAFTLWASDEEYVDGGPSTVLGTNFGNGGDCMFDDPPGCYLHHQASFMGGEGGFFETNFPDVAVSGETYDFFVMPGIDFDGVTSAGDLFGMFNDTPAAQSLMAYLVTAEAQQIWVERGGALSANKDVSPDAYPDETGSRSAEALTGAETVRFDASDLMPAEMGAAFLEAIVDAVQNPGDLDSILADLDAVQQSAYGQ